MFKGTVGQLMIDASLPEEMRGRNPILDKKGVHALLQEVAEKHPDKYAQVAKQLSDVGRRAAFTTGGYSFGPESLRPTVAARKMRLELGRELREIYGDRALDDKTREEKIITTTQRYQAKLVDDVYNEALGAGNPLAQMVRSGTRGSAHNVNSLIGADLLYNDHNGKIIPIPVTRSYSQGLRPVEYFAGAFGARKGVMDLKAATQDAGFLAKQLVQAAHRLIVTGDDDDENPYDEANPRGMPSNTSDPDNDGAYLAHPAGGYPRNTELTPRILKELRSRGIDDILVRSPTVGGPIDGGVYSYDVGRRERSRRAPRGDYVGIAAAQALAEPITQGQISSKHTGGIAGAAGSGLISGFKYINQLVQVPKKGGWAAHAQLDGKVHAVEDAPQGGKFVTVDGKKHYVPHSQAVSVKVGDTVEAGDVLSDGIGNPDEITRHKGIGEARRYFTQAFGKAISSSGSKADRRNIELLARGLINHVRLNDEIGDWSPDDIVSYQQLERQWEPREGHAVVPPTQAVGKYLERPVLHYSIGTKIRPSMLQQMQKFGVNSVYAHPEPPPFQPEMIRGMATVSHDQDWGVRPLGSYQSRSLLESARRGGVSDLEGTSYAPALIAGDNFGRMGATQGWKPESPAPPRMPSIFGK